MTSIRNLLLTVPGCLFAFATFAQEGRVVIADTASREARRSAHQLHIPVGQLKNAREALRGATDLARKMDPPPYDQFNNLAQIWLQLNRTKAKGVIESFIQDMRDIAQKPEDAEAYQRSTSTAMMLINSLVDQGPDQGLQLIRNWPNPPASLGEQTQDFRANMEAQAQKALAQRLAYTDPEKAMSLLSQPAGKPVYDDYSIRGQIAQALMNSGKRDLALKLVDQTMSDFANSSGSADAAQQYENFVRSVMMGIDSDRAGAALNQLIAPMLNDNSGACKGTLKVGDASLDLTCAESKVLGLLNNGYNVRPGLTMKAIQSVPGLADRLESVGGIDTVLSARAGFSSGVAVSLTTHSPSGGISYNTGPQPDSPWSKVNAAFAAIRGKAESDPAFVRAKLHELAGTGEDLDVLFNVVNRASYEDPDVAGIALEIAQDMLPRVQSLQKRSMFLQNLVRAYRQVEGEVDPGLIRDGFFLADAMRQEEDQQVAETDRKIRIGQGITMPDQLEITLISELARDDFEGALNYLHTLPDGTLKLAGLVQVVQALRMPY